MFPRHMIVLAFLAATALPAFAHEFTIGSLTIDHPIAYETPASAKTGAGYMTITNAGTEADRLIGIRADFPKVTLHEGKEVDGVASMAPVDTIEIPAGATISFAPGGLHVMFMGLNGDPFELGEKIPATLIFEVAGEVAVTFNVQPRDDAADMEGMDHPMHDMTEGEAGN